MSTKDAIRLTDIATMWADEKGGDPLRIAGAIGQILSAVSKLTPDHAWVGTVLGPYPKQIERRLGVADLVAYFRKGVTWLGTGHNGYSAELIYVSRRWLHKLLTKKDIEPPTFLGKVENKDDADLGRETRRRFSEMSQRRQLDAAGKNKYTEQIITDAKKLVDEGKTKSQAASIVAMRNPDARINPDSLRQKI